MTRNAIVNRILSECKLEVDDIQEADPGLIPLLEDYVKEYAQQEVEKALETAAIQIKSIIDSSQATGFPLYSSNAYERIINAYKVD